MDQRVVEAAVGTLKKCADNSARMARMAVNEMPGCDRWLRPVWDAPGPTGSLSVPTPDIG